MNLLPWRRPQPAQTTEPQAPPALPRKRGRGRFWAALAQVVTVPTRGALPSGKWAIDVLGDNRSKVGNYRTLYFTDSLVKAGVDNIAQQAVQMGPMVMTAAQGDGEAFDMMRPVATAPHTRLRDWLADLATWYVIDGEIFIVAEMQSTILGEPIVRFRVLDPAQVQPIKNGDALLGWQDQYGNRYAYQEVLHLFDQKVPGQWRGVSALLGAVGPSDELKTARDAMDRAFTEYGKLPGYWTLPTGFEPDLEEAEDGETEEQRAAREKANQEQMNARLSLASGAVPRLPEGAAYTPINRSGDAFMRGYPDYWKSKTAEIARALGIPDYIVSGSVRDTNYSALRIAHMEAKSRYQGIQRMLECVIEWCYIRYMPGGSPIVEIRWPPQPVLDVQKEYYAIGSAITAGLMSPESAMRQIGLDYEQELERMESWVTEATRRGIPVSRPQFPPYPETEDSDG